MWALERGDVTIRPTKFSDIAYLSDRLRKSDVEEIWAATHKTRMEALIYSRTDAACCQTVLYKGEPVALFGCAAMPERDDVGGVWFVASDTLDKMRHAFLRMSRECVGRMLECYPILLNWVDARNQESIRWLKWCGAKLETAKPFGPDNLPFHFFTIRREL